MGWWTQFLWHLRLSGDPKSGDRVRCHECDRVYVYDLNGTAYCELGMCTNRGIEGKTWSSYDDAQKLRSMGLSPGEVVLSKYGVMEK